MTASSTRLITQAVDATRSVIMPAFNAEQYVQESIEFALAQTFGDIEVLVVDDASSIRQFQPG